MTAQYLELELIEKLKELYRLRRLELDLIDQLDSNFRWLIHFCETNSIPLPKEPLYRSLNRVRVLMDEVYPSDETLQGEKRDQSDGDFTVPDGWFWKVVVG
jgi:hypothetical protein